MGIVGTTLINDAEVDVVTQCPYCRKKDGFRVEADGFVEWRYNGALIQIALPGLSADRREQLKTGFCPGCWSTLFGN